MTKNEEILLKKSLNENKVVFGASQTLKLLKQKKIKKIYFAANCPEKNVADIQHYAKLANVPVVKLNKTNDELGTFCKKLFSISILGTK